MMIMVTPQFVMKLGISIASEVNAAPAGPSLGPVGSAGQQGSWC